MPDCWTSCLALARSPSPGLPYGHLPDGWPIMCGGRKKHPGSSVPEPSRFIAFWLSPVITASRASWLENGLALVFMNT